MKSRKSSRILMKIHKMFSKSFSVSISFLVSIENRPCYPKKEKIYTVLFIAVIYFPLLIQMNIFTLYNIIFMSFTYSPFHKTLPRSSSEMHWLSLRFYEIGVICLIQRIFQLKTEVFLILLHKLVERISNLLFLLNF